MAEDKDDSQEKTEDPSQQKLQKAAEDGKVLSSKEMFVFSGVAMGLLLLLGAGQIIPTGLQMWSGLFNFSRVDALSGFGLAKINFAFYLVILATIIIGVPMMIVALLTQAFVGGINFAPKALHFKANRIDPIAGLKRIFSVKGLVELGKSILKVVLLFGIGAVVIYSQLPQIIYLQAGTIGGAVSKLGDIFPLLIAALLVALFAIAMIDYLWQRHTHVESLKMTLKEVKDEFKQTDGSPEVKAKIRRMQIQQSQESARQREALDEVSSASVVITNPTHFAVALKYEAGEAGAPRVVAMGKGAMAKQIMERADEAKVRVLQIPLLARALFFTSNLGAEISEELYNSVAVILAYVFRLDRGESLAEPEVTLPPEMRFDENGKAEKEATNGA